MAAKGGTQVHTSADGFSAALMRVVSEYTDERQEKVAVAVQKAARATKAELVSNSPSLSGRYASGWRMRSARKTFGARASVFNAKSPGLTHLLEKGHGGPHPAGPHVHIEPAYEAGRRVIDEEMGSL